MKGSLSVLGASLWLFAATAHAHPLGFGVLEIDLRGDTLAYLLRVSPEEGESADRIEVHWPAGCSSRGEETVRERDGTLARTGLLTCDALVGDLRIAGLSPEMGVVVRIHRADEVEVHRLDAGTDTLTLGERPHPFASFFRLGLTHALGGLDHLLFLVGMVFVARVPRRIALAVSAFTVGHASSLGLATLGVISVDVPTVELCIAVSLVALAAELVEAERSRSPPIGARHPGLFGAAFGLLHGLGFATALADTGLAASDRIVPLVGFHLGIEAAQLAVVLALLWLMRTLTRPLSLPAAYAVGTLGVTLVLERL